MGVQNKTQCRLLNQQIQGQVFVKGYAHIFCINYSATFAHVARFLVCTDFSIDETLGFCDLLLECSAWWLRKLGKGNEYQILN